MQGEYNGSGWQEEYVYGAGRLVAQYNPTTTELIHADHLGSTRLVTSVSQGIIDNMDYDPYGLQIAGASSTTHKFTSKEWDAETGNDFFPARYYSPTYGRFTSADWSRQAEPVPYAKLDNPQSLNLYSYVLNNPLASIDADGHESDAEWLHNSAPAVAEAEDEHDATFGVTNLAAYRRAQQQTYQHQATQDANVPVTVSQVKANNPFGHSTVQVGSDAPVGLVPNSDKQAAEAVAKQAADVIQGGAPSPESVPGHIESSSAQVKSSTTIYVTTDQAKAMRGYISGAEHSSQSYDATYHNCTNFSEGVLGAGGFHVPADMTPGGLVRDLSQ